MKRRGQARPVPLVQTHSDAVRVGLMLRMSTDKQEASIEVQRQTALARLGGAVARLAPGRGFAIVAEWIDEAVSRAEFVRRPGYHAMLQAAERGEVDLIVMRDETRFGGETIRATGAQMRIAELGVALYFYEKDRFASFDSAQDKLIATAMNMAAEIERDRISARVHEHLERKARLGACAGGDCYGFARVHTERGGLRIVDWAKDEGQATIVVLIFERFAEGWGPKRIVDWLNTDGIPAARAAAWSKSTITAMLDNESYIGRFVWNRVEKAYVGGTKVRLAREEADWVVVERAELRVVSDELWARVRARREQNARLGQRPNGGKAKQKHLLTGIGRCGWCGGPMQVAMRKAGHESVKHYTCGWHRERGDAVCPVTVARPVAETDATVTDWLRREILSEDVVMAIIQQLRARLRQSQGDQPSKVDGLRARLASATRQRDRLRKLARSSDDPPASILDDLRAAEGEIRQAEIALAAATAAPAAIETELDRLETEVRTRINDLGSMFTRNPQEARAVVESLLEGPLRFEATGPGGTGGGNGGRGSRFVITGSANPVGLIRLAPTEFRTDQTPLGTCSVLNLIRSIARTARRECANPRD